jgi:hypothetical protein
MERGFRIFIVLTVLVLAFAAPAAAAPDLPVKGTVTGEHGPPDFEKPGCPTWALWRYSSQGVGRMSHLGRVEYTLTQCTAPGPDGFGSEGTIKLVAANGDELYLEHTMLSQLIFGDSGPDPLGFTFVGTWKAVGGTGRFAHAVGRGMLDGVGDIPDGEEPFDLPDGLIEINLKGRIAYEASDRSMTR